MNTNEILNRISSGLNIDDIVDKLSNYPMSDLNTLMLEVFKRKSTMLNISSLNKNYKSNRFSKPSNIDSLKYHEMEIKLLELAKKNKIPNILLSPVVPFGTSSISNCVNQNNILTSLRNTEVLSDPTNMLCLIIADKLASNITNDDINSLCTSSRCLRTQKYNNPDFFSHFGVFGIVSYGKDKGSYLSEKEMLKIHLDYYIKFIQNTFHKNICIEISKRNGYKDTDGFFSRMCDFLATTYPNIDIIFTEDLSNNYYKGINFKVYILKDNRKIEVVGGGFVDWLNKLTNNTKLRCLTSGICIDQIVLI